MKTFDIEYTEWTRNYWSLEVEAETQEQAEAIFLSEIQGTEPSDSEVTGTNLTVLGESK